MNKKLRNQILKYLLIAGFCGMIGFTYSYHIPNFKIWLIDQAEKLSRKHTPFQIIISDINFTLFPIGVEFKNFKMNPMHEFSSFLNPVLIDKVDLDLSLFSLITGQLHVSKIGLENPIIHLKNHRFPQSKLSEKNKFNIFEILELPFTTVSVHNLTVYSPEIESTPEIQLNKFSFEIENRQSSLLISLITPSLGVRHKNLNGEDILAGIGARILINPKQIYLSALKIKINDSSILAMGQAETDFSTIKKMQVKTKSNLNLTDLGAKVQNIMGRDNFPSLNGSLQNQMMIRKDPQSPIHVTTQTSTQGLKINQFFIDQAKLAAQFQDDLLSFNKLSITNNAGTIHLNDLKLSTKDDLQFSTNLNLEDIQLQTLLKNLGVGDVDVILNINSNLPCEGFLKKEPLLKCTGDLSLNDFRVYNSKLDVVTFKKASAKGGLELSKSQVKMAGTVLLGEQSQGTFNGHVNFKEGFNIHYDTPKLFFSDLTVAALKLEGSAAINGSTKGDGHAATFQMDVQTDGFWIKDYGMGQWKSQLSYNKGDLQFKNLNGQFRTTKYLGQVNLDLHNDRIRSTLKIPYAELGDIQKIFQRKAEFPFEIYGGGAADVKLEGPIEFSLLSYDFKSKFLRGHIANETFDELVFNVQSKNGNVSTKEASLRKNSGLLTMKGTANPNAHINTTWTGENFSLQDFYIFSKSDLGLSGRLDFTLNLTDNILSPESMFRGKISNTLIAQEPFDNSTFEFSFRKHTIDGRAQLFGSTINSDFTIPFNAENPFKFYLSTKNWNFSPLLTIISTQAATSEFTTDLTGEIKLESPKNWLWEANGRIDFPVFKLRRGTKELFATKPIQIKFDKGKMNVLSYQLRGDNTQLEITNLDTSKTNIHLAVNGKIDLSLLSFLTPFMTDIRGNVAISSQILASPNQFSILGSTFIQEGYAKLDVIPHAFENFSIDALFNTDKILINSLVSQFANGRLSARGQVELKGFKNFPTNLSGTFDNVRLKMPEEFETLGSGSFNITGNWFPFDFKSNYVVLDGVITRKFENYLDSEGTRRSSLLPEFLQKKESKVLNLNVQTKFNRGIQVTNDLVDARILGEITVLGTPDSPILLGQIEIPKGGPLTNVKESTLFFRDTPFQISNAELKFNNPQKNNPSIYVVASTKVQEKQGTRNQDYEINLLIQGYLDNYTINLTSNPPRNEKDIISLLALGATTENLENKDSIYKQGVEIGSAILSKNPLGKEIKERTGFNVKLSSGLDEVKSSAVPKITISKQWTPRVGTSASRTFGDFVSQDVKVEYLLNKNVSLVGSWEGKENAPTGELSEQRKPTETNILGIDIEYKVEFK